MQSTNTSPPKSNAPTNLPTSSAPHLPPVTHLASSSTHSPTVPDSVQQQLDHLQLSTNMKIDSLATTFAQRFDQLFALFHSTPSSHTLTPHLTMPQPSTISPTLTLPPHTLPMPTNFRPLPFGIHPRLPPPPPFRHMSEALDNPNSRAPQLRLDLPKFDGQDSAGWLYRIEEYFSFYNTPHDELLRLVGLCIEGSASEWFRWMRGNGLLFSWDDFIYHVRVRFDPDHFEDYIGALSKLQQTSTVLAYQSDFERLLNKKTGVFESTLLSVFISGLKPHPRRDLNLRHPTTLTMAFAMAREVAALHDESSFAFSAPNQHYSAHLQHPLTSAPLSSTTPSLYLTHYPWGTDLIAPICPFASSPTPRSKQKMLKASVIIVTKSGLALTVVRLDSFFLLVMMKSRVILPLPHICLHQSSMKCLCLPMYLVSIASPAQHIHMLYASMELGRLLRIFHLILQSYTLRTRWFLKWGGMIQSTMRLARTTQPKPPIDRDGPIAISRGPTI